MSVFRCRLDMPMLERLHWELNQIMTDEDNLLVIPLCDRCAAKVPEHSTGRSDELGEPPPSFRII